MNNVSPGVLSAAGASQCCPIGGDLSACGTANPTRPSRPPGSGGIGSGFGKRPPPRRPPPSKKKSPPPAKKKSPPPAKKKSPPPPKNTQGDWRKRFASVIKNGTKTG